MRDLRRSQEKAEWQDRASQKGERGEKGQYNSDRVAGEGGDCWHC